MCETGILRKLGIVIFLLCSSMFPKASLAIDVNSLSDICKAMENAISDISLQYEWYLIPPHTKKDIAGTGNFLEIGPAKVSMTVKSPFKEHYLFTRQAVLTDENGNSFESTVRVSYNGECAKRLDIGGLFSDGSPCTGCLSGAISKTEEGFSSLVLTPLGFTILRMQFEDQIYLSEFMRTRSEFVKINDQPEVINGFRTIRADVLAEWKEKKFAVIRIYFSLDNDYTPVRYEYMNGPGPRVGGTIDVNSLQEVQKGLWFPSSGTISSPDDERSNVFRLTGKAVVNQGLKDEIFDVNFPAGTKVHDAITGKSYTIKPTQAQVDQSLPK